MFTMAKIMEMEQVERNKVTLYLFNSVKNQGKIQKQKVFLLKNHVKHGKIFT